MKTSQTNKRKQSVHSDFDAAGKKTSPRFARNLPSHDHVISRYSLFSLIHDFFLSVFLHQVTIGYYDPSNDENKLRINKTEIIWPGETTDVPKDITKKNHLQVRYLQNADLQHPFNS